MTDVGSMNECRLIVDQPMDGAWNMAVDEYLLGWTSRCGKVGWRFYRWREPTLSLGYFQQLGERDRHAPSRACPVVRRASGGGAILHDGELTYSLTVPGNHPLARRRQWTYEAVHKTLIEVLRRWNVTAGLFGNSPPEGQRTPPFLCFHRRSPGDVVVGDTKIAGSAQRRGADAVLQHGSVLLRRSDSAPELPGLLELTGREIGAEQLIEAWTSGLGETLALRWRAETLSGAEEEAVRRIAVEKYGHRNWTEKRRR